MHGFYLSLLLSNLKLECVFISSPFLFEEIKFKLEVFVLDLRDAVFPLL